MKRHFKQDFKRIGHATRVAGYAEKIVKEERGDPAIVLSAAYLHDIGIKGAEISHKSTVREHQYRCGPPVAREILARLDAKEELIEEVCDIISHHHPRPRETTNFRVVHDADLIANLEEENEAKPMASETLAAFIDKSFLTESGRKLARSTLLEGKRDRGEMA
jgi:hypothetical protein